VTNRTVIQPAAVRLFWRVRGPTPRLPYPPACLAAARVSDRPRLPGPGGGDLSTSWTPTPVEDPPPPRASSPARSRGGGWSTPRGSWSV